jgi:endonuclease-3
MSRESKSARHARAAAILERLEAMYPNATCALHYEGPWQLLVAAVLSAQSTDERVNMITPELFRRYPNPAALATASQEEVEEVIKTVGLFHNKAKNLRATSDQLCERFGGEVPASMEDLVSFPGVARKTANVVLGTYFGLATGVVVDTHVFRLAKRLGLTPRTRKDRDKVEQDLMALFPKERWVFLSHALIQHGRTVCTARVPYHDRCRLADLCPKVEV